MSDFYTEQLIKRVSPAGTKLLKLLLILVTVLLAAVVLMFPLALIALVVWVIAEIFIFRSLDLEYEYLFVNGSLDVDKIMSRAKRKHVFEMNVNELEVLAPAGAPELRQYQNLKTTDFTSRTGTEKVYEMIIIKNGAKKRIVFEPNEVILEGMKMMAPRKVFL